MAFEHVDQADYFCFTGPSTFRVYLWDARKDSPTHGKKEVREVGENSAYALIVPAGVVHAYKNVGDDAARRAELDAALLDFARATNEAAPGEPARWSFQYLVVLARPA